MVQRVLQCVVCLCVVVISVPVVAETPVDGHEELLGTYSGYLGGLSISLDIREGQVVFFQSDGDAISELQWQYAGRSPRGELLVRIPLETIQLFYALTPAGLEMRSPANPMQVVTGRNGRPLSMLYRKAVVESAEGQAVAQGGETSTLTRAEPLNLESREFPWNRYDPVVDDSPFLDAKLPSCPEGAHRTNEELWSEGVPMILLTCVGSTGRNGPMIMVLKNRVKILECFFRDDQLEGRFVQRAPKGGKTMDGWYVNGKKQGIWLVWGEEDGDFSHQELWKDDVKIADGKEEGGMLVLEQGTTLQGFSCPDGEKTDDKDVESRTYKYCLDKKGLKHGPAIGWEKTGQVIFRGNFDRGRQHGDATLWYPSGQIMMRSSYNQDYPEGHHIAWHDNGVVSGEVNYENGQPIGIYHEYNKIGGVIAEGSFLEGKKHGLWRAIVGRGLQEQEWDHGNLKSGRVKGIFGTITTKNSDPGIVQSALETLAPILGLVEDWVMVQVLVEKVPRARPELNVVGHEADRTRICEEFSGIRRLLQQYAVSSDSAENDYRETIEAFCHMKFSPDRNPMFPDSPVKVACELSNVSGLLEESGECIEVSPEACSKLLLNLCSDCGFSKQGGFKCSGRFGSKKK